MVEGTVYGDVLNIAISEDVTITINLRGGVLTGETSGCETSTIDTKIDTMERYTRWKYLQVRILPKVAFALFNVFSPFSTEYYEYSPSQGFSKSSSSQYKALKENLYNLATKRPQIPRPPKAKPRIYSSPLDEK